MMTITFDRNGQTNESVTWEVFMHRQIAPEEFTIGDLE